MEPLKMFVLESMTSKRLTKCAIWDIVEVISGEVLATFTEEVLRRISAATLADCLAFTETLQRHKEDFSSLQQHMADCYKALLTNESNRVSASIAIIHLLTRRTSLRIFVHYIRKLIRLPCWHMMRYWVILEKWLVYRARPLLRFATTRSKYHM